MWWLADIDRAGTSDPSGWTLLSENSNVSAGIVEQEDGQLNPNQPALLFSTPFVPRLRLPGASPTRMRGAAGSEPGAGENASPKKSPPLMAHLVRRISGLGDTDANRNSKVQMAPRDEEISMRSSIFATDGPLSAASSPRPSSSRARSPQSAMDKMKASDASGWTLSGARTPGVSMIAKGAPTPSGKDGQIMMLRQMLEERDVEIARLRENEHDLSMSLDRVVYELQTDIQRSKVESSMLQAQLQDQVHRMRDYIVRLESETAMARRHAEAPPAQPAPVSADRHAHLASLAWRREARALWYSNRLCAGVHVCCVLCMYV